MLLENTAGNESAFVSPTAVEAGTRIAVFGLPDRLVSNTAASA
jgi:hypothetical protein